MKKIQLLAQVLAENGISFLEKEPMSSHTTFRIGGPADLLILPNNAEQLSQAAALAASAQVRTFVLGRGSNVLFADEGFNGAVISTEMLKNMRLLSDGIECDAGVSLSRMATAARDAELSGMEFLYGIPGSVGGAVYMNAGAYGGEIAQILFSSTYYDAKSGRTETIALPAHAFGYRESIYRSHPEWIVLSARFELSPASAEEIREKMEDFMTRRREKQPLEYPSAGSVFKRYPGRFTGQMIEACGLKGRRIGGAAVSEKHAGFIVNLGGATAKDVLDLIDVIRAAVYKTFGAAIECELIYVH